ncbi:MAG: DEAD/DEAH box helicase [Balneolales bacterium]
MKDLSFADLNFSKPVQDAVSEMGFEVPTSIQQQCIPLIMEGKDVVGQAQTGTGKTAAFGIPIIEKIDISNKNVQVLLQCPTRELAIQVTGELMKLGQHVKGLHIVPVYGGQPITRQTKALQRGAHVVVGTPGRTIDLLQRGNLKLDHVDMVVFDEADEMLNMGFREDMETILSHIQKPVQTVMFSATVPKAIRDIMKRYMKDPVNITISRQVVSAPDIKQYVVEVRESVRDEAISRLMDVHNYKLAVVFCNTKRQTEKIARELQARGFSCDVINGDLTQGQRDRVMGQFRRGDIDILVATDVAARGIDVEGIDVVFNYDIPQDPEYYIHRIGRTGRAGRSGTAITFSAGRKNRGLRFIEKQIRQQLLPLAMPSVADVRQSRIAGNLNELVQTLEQGGLRSYIEQVESILEDRFTSIEAAGALLKMQMESAGKASPDTSSGTDSGKAAKPAKTYNESDMVGVYFSVGKKNKIHPGDLVGAIAGEAGIPGDVIGNIEIENAYSIVDIPDQYVPAVVKAMNNNQVKGNKVRVKVD